MRDLALDERHRQRPEVAAIPRPGQVVSRDVAVTGRDLFLGGRGGGVGAPPPPPESQYLTHSIPYHAMPCRINHILLERI